MSEQPCPTPGQEYVTEALIAELRQRQAKGIETYGTSLQTFNGRSALRDALDEALDLAQYLKQALMEQAVTRDITPHNDTREWMLALGSGRTHIARSGQSYPLCGRRHPYNYQAGEWIFERYFPEYQLKDACVKCLTIYKETEDRNTEMLQHGDLREQLAALVHEQWSNWRQGVYQAARYGTGGITMSDEFADQWIEESIIKYRKLPDEQKGEWREEAEAILSLVDLHLTEAERAAGVLQEEREQAEERADRAQAVIDAVRDLIAEQLPAEMDLDQPMTAMERLVFELACYDEGGVTK